MTSVREAKRRYSGNRLNVSTTAINSHVAETMIETLRSPE
jgi:hypothetical protein